MKKVTVLIFIVGVLVIISSVLFFFREDLAEGDFYKNIFSGDNLGADGDDAPNINDDGVIEDRGDGDDFEGGSGGGAGGGGSGGDGIVASPGCSIERVPYSLRNFQENVVCREWDDDVCIDLAASCSVGVYNLGDSSTDFNIRYTLLNSSRNELEVKTLSRNIAAGGGSVMSLDFVRSDVGGVDENSICFFSMVSAPFNEIC